MFTCCIRYNIDPDKLVAFREYACAWISLINKYGGIHHGYFIPGTARDNLPNAAFSFPGLGIEGPPNVAVALFSFPSLEAYEHYRMAVSEDELCKATTARFNETKCFTQYERTFLVPMFE
jgi:NIPSNAP